MSKDEFVNDLLKFAGFSNRGQDMQKSDIICRKKTYEDTLDKMWKAYAINPRQIIEYNKQIAIIKESGCRVLRNSAGKHKIII